MKKCTVIDNDTGEILNENFNIDELVDINRKRKIAIKNKEYIEFKKIESEYFGEFVFYVFKHIDKLEKILNDNYLIKFLYCCSFIKQNGYLMLDNNKTYICKKQLKKLLQISNKTFNKFYICLLENSLIKEDNDKIHINICWKGNKNKHEYKINKKIKDFTRLYIKTIRELYINTPFRQHKKIAIVYKLMSYTNFQYNILCSLNTVNEIDEKKLEPLSIKDIINILGYDRTHIARFKKDFFSLKYKDCNIFATIQFESDFMKSNIIVNPVFFYRGNSAENVQYLITLFGLRKIQN